MRKPFDVDSYGESSSLSKQHISIRLLKLLSYILTDFKLLLAINVEDSILFILEL
nr:MAG TPA: hypothetical protein [Caudoviricetes sp.]